MNVVDRWRAAAALLASSRQLLERPDLRDDVDAAADAAADSPWASFLLGLNDDTLDALEGAGLDGPWPPSTPPSLSAWLDRVRAVTALPAIATDGDAPRERRRHERPRKQEQVDAFVRAVRPLATQTKRIVDVGSGHGHLTRAVAQALRRPAIGLERNVALVDHANDLAAGHDDADVTFVVRDVFNDGLDVLDGDCLVGLHACGELGDLVVIAAAGQDVAVDVDVGVAFVGCCLQKQRALERTSLCVDDEGAAVVLPKDLLGLSNLSSSDDGVEASRADNVAARARRLAVKLLLQRAGVDVAPSTELRGVNRRAAHEPLPVLVQRVFQWRGLPVPDDAAVAVAAVDAARAHARSRRLALPRQLLARVLEVFVALDRARFLKDRGFDVDVGIVFSAAVSPRNLIVVATRALRPSLSSLSSSPASRS